MNPRRVLLLVVASAPWGCGPGRTQSAAYCASDADCPPEQLCNLRSFCQARTGCRADTECAANESCDVASGLCLCLSDTACGAGRFCNAGRRCQDVTACVDNSDCQAGTFCDLGTRRCIATGTCGADVQCPLGQLCDAVQTRCVPGCKTSGDCPQTALNAMGVPVFAPQGCVQGQCQAGGCSSVSGCFFSQLCTSSSCVSACTSATPYCRACDRRTGCAGTNNFCLVDPRNGSNCGGMNPPPGCRFFCGIDCSSGQQCPSGYSCYPIVTVVPSQSCTCNTTCSNGTGPCQCNEGATTGFCACRMNNDCGPGLTCEMGACLLGKNCFPSKGLYCDAPGPACP